MKKSTAIILGIIALSFVAGIYLYPQMPDVMASHWNTRGEVDGYISKFWGLFLLPIISLFMLALFLAIPKIDPLKKNIEKFRQYYEWFIVVIILFLFYIYALSISWNLGVRFDMAQVLAPALGFLFYYSGILVKNAKRNWFIGIRTPWTLSSDEVWKKTHEIGAVLFKSTGVIIFLGVIFPQYMFWFVFVPVMFTVLYTMIYSYFIYNKIKRS